MDKSNKELFNIYYNPNMNIFSENDDGMIQRNKIEYYPESDAIKNLNEIEPGKIVTDILDKPFNNLDFSIFREGIREAYFEPDEILNIFNINLPEETLNTLNSLELYNSLKITTGEIAIYLIKEFENKFRLFLFEYNSNLYEPVIRIGSDKNSIKNILGEPSAYSETGSVYIYHSYSTLRQINIIFENDKVKYVQLAAFGGV